MMPNLAHRAVDAYAPGRRSGGTDLPVDHLMSGTLALEEIDLGVDRLRDGGALRQIVIPQPRAG
ncbi:MAG: hypothetical protein WAS21_30640 [Geminicoccaceae bacterium]